MKWEINFYSFIYFYRLYTFDMVHLKTFNFSFRFVTSVLPPGGEDLRGEEVDKIVQFKKALGIDDPDAAAMHVEVI